MLSCAPLLKTNFDVVLSKDTTNHEDEDDDVCASTSAASDDWIDVLTKDVMGIPT
jgi:hypothetical protein